MAPLGPKDREQRLAMARRFEAGQFTKSDFCFREGISKTRLNHWLKHLADERDASSIDADFVEVQVTEFPTPPARVTCELELQECSALLATHFSYPQAVETLCRFLPVGKFSLKLEEQVTAAVANDFMQVQRDEAHLVEPGWQAGDPIVDRTVVASVDGGMCRVRDHDEKYREFKLAVVGDLGPKATVPNKN